MVNPQTTVVIAPAVALTAGRAAALVSHRGPTVNIAFAIVALAIIRRAGELHGFVRSARIVAVVIFESAAIPIAISIPVMIPGEVMAVIPVTVAIPGVIPVTVMVAIRVTVMVAG